MSASWGSDQPQGTGWWQASDGKWYPPNDPKPTGDGEDDAEETAPAAPAPDQRPTTPVGSPSDEQRETTAPAAPTSPPPPGAEGSGPPPPQLGKATDPEAPAPLAPAPPPPYGAPGEPTGPPPPPGAPDSSGNKRIVLIGALVALVVIVVMAALLMGGDGADDYGYSEATERSFVDACVKGAGIGDRAEDFCTCTYDEITERMDFDEFREKSEQLGEGDELPEEFEAASFACRYKIPSG